MNDDALPPPFSLFLSTASRRGCAPGANTGGFAQPAKRKAAASGATTKARQSKLAKEHNITAQEEAEIKEAFGLFAEPMDGEKEGVLPIGDVRRAMMYVCERASTKIS